MAWTVGQTFDLYAPCRECGGERGIIVGDAWSESDTGFCGVCEDCERFLFEANVSPDWGTPDDVDLIDHE